MPGVRRRFFFDIVTGGETVADAIGQELSSPDVAILQAAVLAVDMAEDGKASRNCRIRVRDEHGRTVYTLAVAPRR
jgi:hypothetical protein